MKSLNEHFATTLVNKHFSHLNKTITHMLEEPTNIQYRIKKMLKSACGQMLLYWGVNFHWLRSITM